MAPKIVLHLAAMLIPVPARTPPREGRPTTGLHRCPKEGRSHQINSPLPLQNILPGQTDDLETHRDAFLKKDHLEKPFQMFFPHKRSSLPAATTGAPGPTASAELQVHTVL